MKIGHFFLKAKLFWMKCQYVPNMAVSLPTLFGRRHRTNTDAEFHNFHNPYKANRPYIKCMCVIRIASPQTVLEKLEEMMNGHSNGNISLGASGFETVSTIGDQAPTSAGTFPLRRANYPSTAQALLLDTMQNQPVTNLVNKVDPFKLK